MLPRDDTSAHISGLWQRAAEERRRAARAAAVAARYEEEATLPPASLQPLRARMAALHRRNEASHRAAARLQELHALRLQAWFDNLDTEVLRPVFMAAVAAELGTHSATVVLLGKQRAEALVAASDSTARAAHHLEFALGEGPAEVATTEGRTVRAAGNALRDRWPQYGAVVSKLGVRAVIAVPLQVPTICLGALCAYDVQPVIRDETATAADTIADALIHTMLSEYQRDANRILALPLFDETDHQAIVHQAAGMVSVQCDCGISDALALLRARAFAVSRSVEEVAVGVVRDRLRLC